MPPESIDAIEPPPAARLAISGLRSAMRWPARPPSAESVTPPSAISEISVEVPPMSKATRSGMSSMAAQLGQTDMAPAGPDGPHQHRRRTNPRTLLHRRHAAVRQNDEERALKAGASEALLQPRQITPH